MKFTKISAFAVGLGFALLGTGSVLAAAPKDATGQCADGTYTTAKTKDKGCANHGGVKTWFADTGAVATPSAAHTSGAASATSHTATAAAGAHAGARPKDATGQCVDGTYTTAKTQDKGCTKHGGVKTWFGAAAATAAASSATPAAAPAAAHAAAPAGAQHPGARPKDATGQCADGTYTTAKTQDKGCTKHGGVKTWFGASAATAAASPAASSAPSAAPASAAPASAAAPAATPASRAAPSAAAPATAPAAAPAQVPTVPGQVWVNTATKVYHCPGDKYYGNTKAGKFMSEEEAKAAGYHADHGKACH